MGRLARPAAGRAEPRALLQVDADHEPLSDSAAYTKNVARLPQPKSRDAEQPQRHEGATPSAAGATGTARTGRRRPPAGIQIAGDCHPRFGCSMSAKTTAPRPIAHSAPAPPVDGDAAGMLGQAQAGEQQERDPDRDDVDEEHEAPGEVVDEEPAQQRTDQLRTGGEGGPDSDGPRLHVGAHGGRDQGERARHQQRPRGSLGGAGDDQCERIERCGDRDGGDAEGDQSDPHHEHTAVGVRHRTGEQDQSAQSDEIRVDDPLLGGDAAAELTTDRGQRDVHDRAVEEGHE